MVKKLFKHEILAYLRVFIPMQIILQSVAILYRLLQLNKTDNDVLNIIEGTTVFAYAMCLIISFSLIGVFAIVRFYRNLFTHEGYLSFTLPVSTSQHILVKLFTAVLFEILTVIGMLVSFVIVTVGEFLIELIKAADYLFKDFLKLLETIPLTLTDVIFYVIEAVVLMFIATCAGLLLMYCCIAIGQTFKKNRVMGAIAIYFIYSVVCQFLTSIISTVVTMFADFEKIVEWVEKMCTEHPYEMIHAGFSVMILVYAVMGVIYFAVARFVISRKLNLE